MSVHADDPVNPEDVGAPNRWLILVVMALSLLMVMLDNTVVNVALPAIARDFEASLSGLQWVVDAYILIFAGLMLVAGTMGDRFGRRLFLSMGMIVFSIASAGAALSWNIEALIFFRGLQGVGAALVMPATLSIITAVFPREERARAIGIWAGMAGVGIAIGPPLGGWLVDNADWSAVFWLTVPVAGISLISLRIVPESRDGRRLPIDVPGAILGTVGISALVYGIIEGNVAGWGSPEIVIALTLALVTLAAFVWVELRSPAPMLRLDFFRERDFTGAVLVIGVIFFAMIGVFFFITQYFQIVQEKTALEAGLMGLPAAGAMMVSAPLSGRLAETMGPKVLALISGAIIAAGLLWLAQLDVDSSFATAALGLVAFGLGGGLGMAPLTDTVMAAVPVDDAGLASGVNGTIRELGGALGIAVLGSVVTGIYTDEIEAELTGAIPPDVLESAGEGIGVAAAVAAQVPPEIAEPLTRAANAAFVDGFTTAFYVSAGVVVASMALTAWLIPWRQRHTQATEIYAREGLPLGEERQLEPEPAVS